MAMTKNYYEMIKKELYGAFNEFYNKGFEVVYIKKNNLITNEKNISIWFDIYKSDIDDILIDCNAIMTLNIKKTSIYFLYLNDKSDNIEVEISK